MAQRSRMVSTRFHDPSSSTDRSRDTAGDEATITPRSATVIPAGKDSIEQLGLMANSHDRAGDWQEDGVQQARYELTKHFLIS